MSFSRLAFLSLLLLAGAPAQADVVHLTNGGRIQGQVVEETDEQVEVKTLSGRVRIPRREVARIERESPGETLLGQARQAAYAGERARAIALYERALATQEPAVVRRAEQALAELRAAPALEEPADEAAGEASWVGGDPFAEEEREALIRELETAAGDDPQLRLRLMGELYKRGTRRRDAGELRLAISDFRRARALANPADAAAIRSHEYAARLVLASKSLRRAGGARLAHAAAKPVAEDPESGALRVRGQFLFGRACEELNFKDPAREAFQAALGGLELPNDRDLATHRELARQAAAGFTVDEHSPGVGPGWRWVRTRHFAILHQLDVQDPSLGTRLEEARRAVIKRLELRGRLDEQGRVVVFLFRDLESYRGSEGARAWSAGHASRLRTEHDLIRAIYLYPSPTLDDLARHEIAHILLGDAMEDALLPAWVNEGAAVFAESETSRQRWRLRAQAQAGELRPLEEALAQMLPPLSEDPREAQLFYTQAALSFELLIARTGLERTLQAALRINAEGPVAALRSVRVRLSDLENAQREALVPRR